MTNHLRKRVTSIRGSGTTTYLFDGDAVLADSRADYTHGGATGLISERAGATTKHYHGDQLTSTRGLSNSAQTITDTREYDAWGLVVATSGSSVFPFQFVGGQGYQRDTDSGLMLLGVRYYDPSIGRFITRDPIGYKGGLNLYVYCQNDPTSCSDPRGTVRLIGGASGTGVIGLPGIGGWGGIDFTIDLPSWNPGSWNIGWGVSGGSGAGGGFGFSGGYYGGFGNGPPISTGGSQSSTIGGFAGMGPGGSGNFSWDPNGNWSVAGGGGFTLGGGVFGGDTWSYRMTMREMMSYYAETMRSWWEGVQRGWDDYWADVREEWQKWWHSQGWPIF